MDDWLHRVRSVARADSCSGVQMTEAADTGDIVPTASVLARGASRDYKPHLIPSHAAKAIPANMMMTSGQSIGSRSSLMQALIDIGAILFAAFFICLFAVAVAVAVFAFLFVKF